MPQKYFSMQIKKKKKGGALGTVTTCVSTTMVLILLGMVTMFVLMADNFSRNAKEEFCIFLSLNDSISERDRVALQGNLTAQPYAKMVEYVSKEQGTRDIMDDLNASPEELLGESPIPATFEVLLKAEYVNKDSLARYMPELKGYAGVDVVDAPIEAIDKTDRFFGVVSLLLLCIAALLAFISFTLINNTVRMSIYAHRFTINTMKLVGAKWSFIRKPFMARAFWVGLISAIIAGGLLAGALRYIGMLYEDFALVTPLVFAITIGCVFVCGLTLTLLCTFISVNRHLRMTADEVFLK